MSNDWYTSGYTNYDDAFRDAQESNFPETDLACAALAPTKYVEDPDYVELSFQKTLNHLERAIAKFDKLSEAEKATDKQAIIGVNIVEREQISHYAVEVFQWHIFHCSSAISQAKKRNNANIIQKAKGLLLDTRTMANVFTMTSGNRVSKTQKQAALISTVFTVIGTFADNIYSSWKIKKSEAHYFNQVVSMFDMMVKSDSFKDLAFNLIYESFEDTDTRLQLMSIVVDREGVDEVIALAEDSSDGNTHKLDVRIGDLFDSLTTDLNNNLTTAKYLVQYQKRNSLRNYDRCRNVLVEFYTNKIYSEGTFANPSSAATILGIGGFFVLSILTQVTIIGLIAGIIGYFITKSMHPNIEKIDTFKSSI